jgi:hypothetical protein
LRRESSFPRDSAAVALPRVLLVLLLALLRLRLLLSQLLLVLLLGLETFKSNLRSVFFGVEDVVPVVPEAGWDGLAVDLDAAGPSSASS